MWTVPQRAVVLVFVIVMVLYLSVRLAIDRSYISNPPPPSGSLADQVVDRIDPNTATRGMLAALPNVGEKLAEAIVEYREQFAKKNPGRPVFTRTEDLRNVRGIGPAKVESLQNYLIFPAQLKNP